MAQLLAEEILMAIDEFSDGVLKPVVVLWEEGVVAKCPVEGVVQKFHIRICAISNGSGDGLRERLSTSLGVEAGLGFCSTLRPDDDTVEPVRNANISAAVVGNINDELFGTSRLEVLQTCEEAFLELSERGGTKTAKGQNTGLRLVQVVELGD